MRSPDEFEEIHEETNIRNWNVRQCPRCKYDTGFRFDWGTVGFDVGCMCTGNMPLRRSNWRKVADFYNKLEGQEKLKADKIWGFYKPNPYEKRN